MTGQRLILNADIHRRVTIEGGSAGYADGLLWLYFNGYTMEQASAIFFDTSNTNLIIFQYGDMQDEYRGYTDCRAISRGTNGIISVCMAKGAED